jgi:RimJ/RimL family protein N-acetyltransferase
MTARHLADRSVEHAGWSGAPGILPGVRMLTRRLVVRRFHPADAGALAVYRSDPEVARYQSWSAPVSLEAAATLVDTFAAGDPYAPGWFQYAIELRSNRALIGDIGVHLHDNLMQAEIGFTLAREHQRHGYASEALRCVLEHLFTDRGLHRVSADCDARNVRSARLLERLGFQQEGRRRANTWIKDEWTDDLLFGLLAREWRRSTT